MFRQVFKHEFWAATRKPLLYLYLLGLSSLAFLAFVANSGALDDGEFNGKIINSPFEIHYLVQYFNKFFMFLLPAVIGSITYKDFKYNAHSILFSYPLKKGTYLFGKFLSGFFITLIIVCGVLTAMVVAEVLPIYPEESQMRFSIVSYLKAFLVYSLPNIAYHGTIVFFVVLLSRNIYAGFVWVLILFFVQNISQNVFDGNGFLISLFDPFASNSFEYITSEWNQQQKNTLDIPINGIVLWNRFFWFVLTLFCVLFGWSRFKFHQHSSFSWTLPSLFKRKISRLGQVKGSSEPSRIQFDFGFTAWCKVVWHLGKFHFNYIIRSRMFLILLILGVLAVIFAVGRVTNSGEINILPVTNVVLTIPAFFFYNIAMLITFIYAGMLVLRERNNQVYFLTDATSVSTSAMLLGKVLALLKMQFLLVLTLLVAGVGIQLYNGYSRLEMDLYFINLFGIQYVALVIWAFISVAIHVFSNNLYLGVFLLLLTWLGVAGLQQMGVTSSLLLFNFSEPLLYSSLSRYNGGLASYFLVKGYWLFISALLLAIGFLFYRRGYTLSLPEYLKKAKSRIGKKTSVTFLFLLAMTLVTGSFIYSEESKRVLKPNEEDALFSKFKSDFEKYSSVKEQPSIVAIDLDIALYPDKRAMKIEGEYLIRNRTDKVIDTLLIKSGFNEKSKLELSVAHKIIDQDEYVDFHVYELAKPLLPKDSIRLYFGLENQPESLFQNTSKSLINGTFFRNNIFPRFGYFLEDSIPNANGILTSNKSYYRQGGDLVNVNTTISTKKGRVGLAPGKLMKTWESDERQFFRFETQKPICNSLSFHSGDFETRGYLENDISLDIHFHDSHFFNIESMKAGFYEAMNFNKIYFGEPLQKNFSIVEFPMTQGSFATLMGNVIPTSEMRFIADSKISEGNIDLAFYVVAHEATHHWFGELLSPANTKGATVLTESITEYISLRIYEQQFGKDAALQFLNKQHQRYWGGSVRENEEEPPLMLALPDQEYLTYGKGTIALNTLGHYWCHENLLEALGSFFKSYASRQGSYPTTNALLGHLMDKVPFELQYILEDYFKTTISHKLNTIEVEQFEKNGAFELNILLDISKKLKGKKNTKSILGDYFEIGCYNQEGSLIEIERIKTTKEGQIQLDFQFNEKVSKVVLDPNKLLLLKNEKKTTVYL